MKIDNIKINAYGKLKNKDLNFNEGINIVKGDNESGKSTLLNYITDIFYGISKNKDGKEISDFDKYKPWNGEDFSGRIEYSLDNGNKYEVFREFKSKNPKIYNEKMEEISSEYNIDKKEGNKFFFEQTKVDKLMFLSTVVSMQQEVKLETKDQNVLIQKIANIASSGDDSISYKKANEKLQNKIRDEIGTNKTSQKPINILQNEINTLSLEISQTEEYENRKYAIDNEKEDVLNKIQTEKSKRDLLNKLNDNENKYESDKQKLNIIENNKKENEIKLKELYNQIDSLEIDRKKLETERNIYQTKLQEEKDDIKDLEIKQSTISYKNVEKTNKKEKIITVLFVISLIGFIINICTINNIFITICLSVLIIALLIAGITNKINTNKEIKEQRLNQKKLEEDFKSNIEEKNKSIEILEQQDKEISVKQNEIIKQISNIEGKINLLEESNKHLIKQIEILSLEINEKINKQREDLIQSTNSIDISSEIASENLTEIINNTNENILYLENKLNKLEIEESTVIPKLEKLVILKEKKESCEEKIKELQDISERINITIESLKEAYEEMKTTITPKFTKELSESITKISNGTYSKVTINDEKGMIVENENGEYIDINRLSIGTIDELYLGLRLSMIDELSEENMPILLDETFAYFDTKRMEAAVKYLESKSYKHQIIIFTCSSREIDILDKLNLKYNIVEL